jgi:hypothetical protein
MRRSNIFERDGGGHDGIQQPNKSIFLPICDAPMRHDRSNLGIPNRMSERNNSPRPGIPLKLRSHARVGFFKHTGCGWDSSLRGARARSIRAMTDFSLTLFSSRRHVDRATGSVTGITNT